MLKLNPNKNHFFRTLFVVLALSQFRLYSQCTASFVPIYNLNGSVTFSVSPNVQPAPNYSWYFSDGTSLNNAGPIVNHVFPYNGNFTATLTLYNYTIVCNSTYTSIVTINNSPCNNPINAVFNHSAALAGTITATSLSTGTTIGANYTYFWGDGNTSNGAVSSHTYNSNGWYNLKLVINDGVCNDTSEKQIYISTVGCSLSPSFNYTNNPNGNVSFASTSTGTTPLTNYNWDFGDGNTAVGANTNHTYQQNGIFQVELKLQQLTGTVVTCVNSSVTLVTINNNSCNITPSYTFSNGVGGLINFTSTSTGTLPGSSYLWKFGDGTTGNGLQTSHTYSNGGIHNATLVVTNSVACSDSIANPVNVTGIPCLANSNFTMVYSGSPLYWFAVPNYYGNVVNAQWNWGDGTTSNLLFTSHTYSPAGLYTICLTVTVSCGNSSTSCTPYNIFKSTYTTESAAIATVVVVPEKPVGTGLSHELNQEVHLDVFPQPNNGKFTVRCMDMDETSIITLKDLSGKTVRTFNLNERDPELELDCTELNSGIYFLQYNGKSGSAVRKISIIR